MRGAAPDSGFNRTRRQHVFHPRRFVRAGYPRRYAANLTDFGGASDMNQKQRAEWEQTRAKGMWRFVLLCAILASVSVIIAKIIFYSSLGILVGGVIGLVVGSVGGLVLWFIREYRYRKSSGNASAS